MNKAHRPVSLKGLLKNTPGYLTGGGEWVKLMARRPEMRGVIRIIPGKNL
jgi:hypothetical protein